MSAVKNKIKLCETSLSDFSIEQIGGVPFYNRYPEFERLFRKLVPSVEFDRNFAQPYENKTKRLVEWYFIPGTESPSRLSDIISEDTVSYNAAVLKRNSIIEAIKSAMDTAGEYERKFLSAVLTGISSTESDSTTYSYDGSILFGVWGMKARPGRKIEDVIREDVLDHRVFTVSYSIEGKGILSFSSVGRKYGHRLKPTEVPTVTPDDGWRFAKWEPEIPHGWTVTKDMSFVAVCDKEGPKGKESVDTGGFTEPQLDGTNTDNPKYQVSFKSEEGGCLQGTTEYHKFEGEEVLSGDVPTVVPEDGYEFIGWDSEPNGYIVHSDAEFVAKFRKKADTYKVQFVSDEGGILKGCTEYVKHDGEIVQTNEIPNVVADDGYEFIGWDHKPDGYEVHSDTKFIAQFRRKNVSWWSRFWGWGSGCLSWLLMLLLLGLIGLLLWYLLSGYRNFNFCGCDCENNNIDTIVVPDETIVPTPPVPDPEPVPHTGDVQILLKWSNHNDLDISCVDPYGKIVWYRNKKVPSGGELDIDMNVDSPYKDNPIENIYWPSGGAPKGKYTVYLTYYERHDSELATPYTISVKHGDVVDTYTGIVKQINQPVKICTFNID